MGPGSEEAEPPIVKGGRGPRAQFLRCGADGARSLTRLQSPPALSSGRRARTQSAGLHPASVSPGSQPHLLCCPELPGVECPARPPSPRESVPPRVQPRTRAGRGLTALAVEQSEPEPQAQAQRGSPLHLRPLRRGSDLRGRRSGLGVWAHRASAGGAGAWRGRGGAWAGPLPPRGGARPVGPPLAPISPAPPAEGACWLDQRVPVSLSCWRLVRVPLPSPPGLIRADGECR